MSDIHDSAAEAAPPIPFDMTERRAGQPETFVERRTADRRQHDRRRQEQPADALAADASRLCTGREQQTLQLLLQGMSNKQIAKTMGIAEDTVKKHLHHVYRKLGVRRRALLMVKRAGAIKPQRNTTSVE